MKCVHDVSDISTGHKSGSRVGGVITAAHRVSSIITAPENISCNQ